MKNSDLQLLKYKVSRIEFNITDSWNLKKDRTLHQSIEVKTNFSDTDKHIVEVSLKISIKTTSGSITFEMEIKGEFQRSENISDDLFHVLANQNAPAILFPFARSIITSYTALANIPPIILPTVNFAIEKKEIPKLKKIKKGKAK